MRASGQITRQTLQLVTDAISPGVTTGEVDRYAGEMIRKTGGTSAFKGYHGFPGNVCISVNEEVVHGIGGDRKIHYGDIVKIDMGIFIEGWLGDTATTVVVGAVDEDTEKLLRVTRESLDLGIAQARAGNRVGDIGHAVQKHVEAHGYGVVREFVGHGLGRKLHEEPQVPNYGKAHTGAKLRPGMIIAIEPMVTAGDYRIRVLKDKWTVVTIDGSLASHYEHTVLITDQEAEILTCLPEVLAPER